MIEYNGNSVGGVLFSESPIDIVQEMGDSVTSVMSQKAVTENFENILSAFEVEICHNLLDPNNSESGHLDLSSGAIVEVEAGWNLRTAEPIPIPSGAKNIYISTNADVTNTDIASKLLVVFYTDTNGNYVSHSSRKLSNLYSTAVPNGATHILFTTAGANLGLTFDNFCLSVVDVPYGKYLSEKKPIALKSELLPDYCKEHVIYSSGYTDNELLRENQQLKRDLEFMLHRQSGLYDLKSGATVDSQTVTLKNTKKQKLILHIHRYANNGFDTTNDVFLPNAKKTFDDLRITDNNGKVLPYFINSISDLDIVEDSRIHIVGDNMMLKDSKGNLISCKSEGLVISTDNGNSWNKIEGLDGCRLLVAINPDDSLLVGSSNDRKLYKSYAPYTSKEMVLDCSNYTDVYFGINCTKRLSSGSLILGAYQLERSIRIYKSTDNGSTWAEIYADNSGKYQHIHSIFVDHNQDVETIYASCDGGGGVLKSTDGGASWTDLREANPNMPQATDYGVIYSEKGFRLFGGETQYVGGYSILRTEDDVNFTPVLAVGNGVYAVKKFGGYIIAGLTGAQSYRAHGIVVSKDNCLTWEKIYSTSLFTDTAGASDGFRRMDDTIFENTLIVQCQSASRKTVRITAHDEPIYAEIIVDVPEDTTSVTVENGYAIGNTFLLYNEYEPANRKLLHFPLNENSEFIKETVSGDIYKADFGFIESGKTFSNANNKHSALLSSLKGFARNITLPNKFTISFWDSRPTESADKFNLIRKGEQYLRINGHLLQSNTSWLADTLYPFRAGAQKVDITVDGENKIIKSYVNGYLVGTQSNATRFADLLTALADEGEIVVLENLECTSEHSIQHFTIYEGILTEYDMLNSVHFELSDNHQTV